MSNSSLFGPKADRLLALFGAAGVGVSLMEPRLFWVGVAICLVVALFAIRPHLDECRRAIRDWKRFRNYKKRKRTNVPGSLLGALALIAFCVGIPIILLFNRPPEPILNYGILSNSWYERLIAFISRSRPLLKMEIGHSGTIFN